MKFNTLRYLTLPWFIFFCLVVTSMIVDGTQLHFSVNYELYLQGALAAGILICLFFNLRTLTKSGIWLADSLPYTIRRYPWVSYLKAAIALAVAGVIYSVGELPWVPVLWQGFVNPIVFTICLFVTIWALMERILIFCSRVSFSRLSAFVFSWPIFALVPITALFLGNNIVKAYQESRPDFAFSRAAVASDVATTPAEEKVADDSVVATHPAALELQEAANSKAICARKGRMIQAALTSDGDADTVYWAIRASSCGGLKNVITIAKLADIMVKHPNVKVRAAAIRQMPSFDRDSVKRIGYLLVKRLGENEPPPVIEAAAVVLIKLGETEQAWVSKKMTLLLNNPKTSALAARVLVTQLKREDLITEFVTKNLTENSPHRTRAISMICSLSEANRKLAEPHIDLIITSIKKNDLADPAVKTLECLGQPGLEAVRRELAHPDKMSKEGAAQIFAQATWQDSKAVLDTATQCVRDASAEVRQWCSQALGKVGVTAIPTILELLKSGDMESKKTAAHALSFFSDSEAKQELMKERTKNSGWMANQKNLDLARSIDQALINMK